MSENKKNENLIIRMAAGALGETIGGPIGGALAPVIEYIFGSIQRSQIYHDLCIKDLLQRIFNKCKKIPSNQIQEPPLNIIGPALEASKYHIAVEEMRKMFANLVAHACDKEMAKLIHPAFVNILTQITPLEASLLSGFRPKTDFNKLMSISFSINGKEIPSMDNSGLYAFPERIYPIVNYYYARGTERRLAQSNVIQSEVTASVEEIAASVTNLVRLGLIETNFQMQVKNQEEYEFFTSNDLYQKLQDDINPKNGVSLRAIRENMILNGQYNEIVLEKGIVCLTPFGFNFMEVCVLEEGFLDEKA